MQPSLFSTRPSFNGPGLTTADHVRLSNQQARILDLMRDQQWRTLRQIAEATGAPEASASAQIRHLRKKRFGSHTVERRHLGRGLYEYRVLVADGQAVRER